MHLRCKRRSREYHIHKWTGFTDTTSLRRRSHTYVLSRRHLRTSTTNKRQTMGQESNVIGCWRAHMNVYQKIVHEKVSSAMIFEDDADWDVALKMQLVQFARGSRFILNTTESEATHSPYGDDWD